MEKNKNYFDWLSEKTIKHAFWGKFVPLTCTVTLLKDLARKK